MITTVEDFKKKLEEIEKNPGNGQIAIEMINADTESKFLIDANSRTIKIPTQFEDAAAICRDHDSETIYFEIDQYFDDVDLYQKSCIIQYVNANGGQYVFPVTDKYLTGKGKIIFAWDLNNNATAYAGQVRFSVRFYTLKNGVYTYNWSTKPATINIGEGLYITDSGETLPNGDDITQLVEKINGIYMNGDLSSGTKNYNDLSNRPMINGVLLEGDLPPEAFDLKATIDEDKVVTWDKVDKQLSDLSNNPIANSAVNGMFATQTSQIQGLADSIVEINSKFENLTFVPLEVTRFLNKPIPNSGNYTGDYAKETFVRCKTRIKEMYFDIALNKDVSNSIFISNSANDYVWEKAFKEWTLTSDGVGRSYPVSSNNSTITLSSPGTITFKAEISDAYSSASAETKMTFCNLFYWGSKPLTDLNASTESVVSSFISGLGNEQLSPNADNLVCTTSCGKEEYIYLAIPKERLGYDGTNVDIAVGGFVGGFEKLNADGKYFKVKKTVDSENTTYEYEYDVYRSLNPNLGSTTMTLSERG
jgi:hypothetical protein